MSEIMTNKLLTQLISEICGAPSADIDDALSTAQLAHLGQTRRSGEAYIEHPKEVARIVYSLYNDPVLCAAALLHDSLEDAVDQGNFESIDDLKTMIAASFGDPRIGTEALRIVQSLTHNKNVPYSEYVTSLLGDPSALRVKLSDMLHNLRSNPSPRQLEKYSKTLQTLQNASGGIPQGINQSHWNALQNAVSNKSLRVESLRHTIRSLILETKEPTRMPLNLPIPGDLQIIHQNMKSAGMQLYVVGGAVRDTLMNKPPKDYDLATNAPPEEVIKILKADPALKIDLTGKAFGVVRVVTPENNEYEIATFRKDIGKGRRPDAVEFTSIEDDVNRRDLTINALFYDMDAGEAVDYVGGIEDIQNGIIRAVGDPTQRFDEDKLRILRAVRFAGRMGSDLDPETKEAILDDNDLSGVSPDRIRDEFIKGIKSAQNLGDFLALTNDLKLFPQIFPGLSVSLDKISSNKESTVQVALLLTGNDPQQVENVLRKMKYTNQEINTIKFLHNFTNIIPEDAPRLKKEFNRVKIDEEVLRDFTDAVGSPSVKAVDVFLQFAAAPPAANPRDLMSQGLQGPDIGTAMQTAEIEAYRSMLGELRAYIKVLLLTEDSMGFVHDLAAASDEFGEPGFDFFGGDPGKGGGKAIKRAFNKHADHQWLSTLDTVHWSTAYNLAELVGKGKDELSTTMTLPGEPFTPLAGNTGLWIKGRITLAANDMDHLYSGHGWEYGIGKSLGGDYKEVSHRDKSSGRNKRPTTSKDYSKYGRLKRSSELHRLMAQDIPYVLDQSMWSPRPAGGSNEALVDNWKPIGLIIHDEYVDLVAEFVEGEYEIEHLQGVMKKLFKLAIEMNVPLFDLDRNELWRPSKELRECIQMVLRKLCALP